MKSYGSFRQRLRHQSEKAYAIGIMGIDSLPLFGWAEQSVWENQYSHVFVLFSSTTVNQLEIQSIRLQKSFDFVAYAYTLLLDSNSQNSCIWQILMSSINACIRTHDRFTTRRFLHVGVLHMNPVLSNLLLDFLEATFIHSQFILPLSVWTLFCTK